MLRRSQTRTEPSAPQVVSMWKSIGLYAKSSTYYPSEHATKELKTSFPLKSICGKTLSSIAIPTIFSFYGSTLAAPHSHISISSLSISAAFNTYVSFLLSTSHYTKLCRSAVIKVSACEPLSSCASHSTLCTGEVCSPDEKSATILISFSPFSGIWARTTRSSKLIARISELKGEAEIVLISAPGTGK